MPLWAMNLINKQLGTVWTGHEVHYSLVETSNDQLSIQSLYFTQSGYSGQQSPHEYY